MDFAVLKHNYCNCFGPFFLFVICTDEIEPRQLTEKVEQNTKLLLHLSGSALVYQRDHLIFGHQVHKERNQKY